MEIIRLRTENKKEPLGIDKRQPAFSWNVMTKKTNWKQKAYRIIVKKGGLAVWDSGKVLSDRMVQVQYDGAALESDCRYDWMVEVTGMDEETVWKSSWFETGLFDKEDWRGVFLGETEDGVFHIFRRVFHTEKKAVRAKVYICGLGHYVCNINGKSVTDAVLEPGWSDYDKTCFYGTYDVTELMREGENAIGVMLGDGMYNLPGGRYVYYGRSYGKMKFCVQLHITYEDGTREVILTDHEWKMAKSPLLFCCMYGGEDYDGRLQQAQFSDPDYKEDESWENAKKVSPPKGKLVSSPLLPLKVMETLSPVSVRRTGADTWLYDFGTNFSGWARILLRRNHRPSGSKVIMTPGEIIDEHFVPDQRVTGRGYAWTYYLNEEETQEFAPDFTYTGFRYLEVKGACPACDNTAKNIIAETNAAEGWRKGTEFLPVIEDIRGEFIYPDTKEDGTFTCSMPLFNQIHGIIRQAVLSNMKSYLTDCPHRERLGWLEQTHLIAAGVMYNFDVESLYEKQEQDMQDAQHLDGLVPDICPEYVKFGYHEGFTDSPEWGSACIINPYYLYQRYGDTVTMRRHYDSMKKYLAYLDSKTHHGILHHGLGDWLDIGPNKPWSQNTPVPVIATCIFYYDLCIMERTAHFLENKEDEEMFAKRREEVFREYNLQFFDKETFRYATGSQAAQAMSLVTGLVPQEYQEKVAEVLRKDIENRDYAVTAGDVGHPFLITAAILYDLNDLIYKMTIKTDTPGYGYQIAHGATTLTEEWDGPMTGNLHGSQNHFMLGGIEEWFYAGLGGIRLLHREQKTGEVLIKPYVPEDLDYCRVALRHPYGMLRSEWEKCGSGVRYLFEIPANVTAQLEFSGKKIMAGSGIWEFKVPV